MKLEVGKIYITADSRKARIIGATDDGRFAAAIDGRKMIETYGGDGTFRLTSDREADEGLHLVRELLPRIRLWFNVYADGKTSSACASRRVADTVAQDGRSFVWAIECDQDGSDPEIVIVEKA